MKPQEFKQEKNTYTVSEIEYDTDGEEVDLPEILTIKVPNDCVNEEEVYLYISDEISNRTGFCHKGFVIDKNE